MSYYGYFKRYNKDIITGEYSFWVLPCDAPEDHVIEWNGFIIIIDPRTRTLTEPTTGYTLLQKEITEEQMNYSLEEYKKVIVRCLNHYGPRLTYERVMLYRTFYVEPHLFLLL